MHRIYRRITHQQRITAIYLRVVHSLPLKEIKKRTKVKYNTIRNILRTYRKSGRTNKLGLVNKNNHATDHLNQLLKRPPVGPRSILPNTSIRAMASTGGCKSNDNFGAEDSSLLTATNGRVSPDAQFKEQTPPPSRCSLDLVRITPAEAQDLYAGAPAAALYRLEKSRAKDEGKNSIEMISTDVTEFQNLKDSQLELFNWPLNHLNSVLSSTEAPEANPFRSLDSRERRMVEQALRPWKTFL